MATVDPILERRSRRHKVIMPIALVANPDGERALVPASALDFSLDGLRIQTSVRLSIGELIHIQLEKDPTELRQYKVVWTKPDGALRPAQAGLRSLESACDATPGPLTLASIDPLTKAA
jgi:hypothetical protein